MYSTSDSLLRQATAIDELLPAEQRRTGLARDYGSMSDLCINTHAYADAITAAEKSLFFSDTLHHGVGSDPVALSLESLGYAARATEHPVEAEKLLAAAAEAWRIAEGPHSDEYAGAIADLGSFYSSIKRFSAAESLLQRAYNIRYNICQEQNPTTATIMHNLGVLYYKMGQTGLAVDLLSRAAEIDEKFLGPDHPTTLLTLNTIGTVGSNSGDYALADRYYLQNLERLRKQNPPCKPCLVKVLRQLSYTAAQRGDEYRATGLYREAMEFEGDVIGPDNPMSAQWLLDLALRTKDPDTKDSLYNASLRYEILFCGPQSPRALLILTDLTLDWHYRGEDELARGYGARLYSVLCEIDNLQLPQYSEKKNEYLEALSCIGFLTEGEKLFEANR
jgi:tetratricopeptide (TPR) repeat protein